jgi:hypothetical protein
MYEGRELPLFVSMNAPPLRELHLYELNGPLINIPTKMLAHATIHIAYNRLRAM